MPVPPARTTSHTGWLIDLKPDATTLSPNRQEVYAFDLEGRPVQWFIHGQVFKRSLASDVYGRNRHNGSRRRWQLTPAQALEQFETLLRKIEPLKAVRHDDESRERLERILSWTPERLLAEQERFAQAYQPISILPPDQYGAVVLQATFGCSWNRCTFCTFYQDRPFSTKNARSFTEHAHKVRGLLGEGEKLRRSIFLADGNALILSNTKLRPLFSIAKAAFPHRELYGFVDVFTGERKSLQDWRELHELGLKRVYIGLETGHDPLLQWLNKPGGRTEAHAFITTLKEAGVQVSPILMVGVGGKSYAEAHVKDTLELIQNLPLSKGDLIYLSPFVAHEASTYVTNSQTTDVRPLTPTEQDLQYQALRDGARRAHPQVQVALYHIQEFIY